MKAAIFKQYGKPDVITIEDVPKTTINSKQILIRVHASTVNSGDARLRRADPWLVRLMFGLTKPNKSKQILGVVFAGQVVEVGEEVKDVAIGTRVYGLADNFMGGHGEYMKINSTDPYSIIPDQMSYNDAAAIAFGGTTAIHFLRDLELNNKTILINGASGAVGTSLVQIAKARGAIITTITSNKNMELMTSLGATNTIDYQVDMEISNNQEYDIVFDCINNLSIQTLESKVKKDGKIFLVAGLIKEMIASKMAKKAQLIVGTAKIYNKDYQELNNLYLSGKLKPVITSTFKLEDITKAHQLVDNGHKVGNIVVEIK